MDELLRVILFGALIWYWPFVIWGVSLGYKLHKGEMDKQK